MPPLVSIITPSYNQAAYLEETLLSVLEQDYPNLEYIVVDGGSTDGSQEIIKKYQHRLAWWVSEADRGQADAINKGLAHAKGEIAAWLNSDDKYQPGAVSQAVSAFLAFPQAVMVYGNMLAIDARGQIFNALRYRQLTLDDLLCFEIIGQPAVFMHRETLNQVAGLDTSFHYMLDHQLWIKLAARGEIRHENQTWAAARYHPQAKNRAQAVQFGLEAFRILDWAHTQPELRPALGKNLRRAKASAQRVNARYLLDGGQPWKALKAWSKTLSIDPPTALARLNILVSAILNLLGLGKLRARILRQRQKRFS